MTDQKQPRPREFVYFDNKGEDFVGIREQFGSQQAFIAWDEATERLHPKATRYELVDKRDYEALQSERDAFAERILKLVEKYEARTVEKQDLESELSRVKAELARPVTCPACAESYTFTEGISNFELQLELENQRLRSVLQEIGHPTKDTQSLYACRELARAALGKKEEG